MCKQLGTLRPEGRMRLFAHCKNTEHAFQVHSVECVSMFKSIISVIFKAVCGYLCF